MGYDAGKEWTNAILAGKLSYPSEYVIRIFKGSYPRLNLDKASFRDKKICDVGCGNGRNIPLLTQCGFSVYGTELTEKIVEGVKNNLLELGLQADIRVGRNDSLPFDDSFFDYMLSWNVCYYMGDNRDFSRHVSELARVLRKNGYLVLSIPKKTCFIYEGSEPLRKDYRIIKKDPFNVRNGEVLRFFENEKDIELAFSTYFKDFVFASVHDDCFGYNYHWHLTVCRKK